MDQIEQIVSGLMMPIKKEVNDAYYYGRHPEKSRKVLSNLEDELAKKFKEQYELGWKAGEQATLKKLLKGLGGHK
ncbi:hypothetical protein [Ligilactobacillus apodemi]|uniref:Uncharacterized protein n=1 Tax=Ligilactobacillus apodemi DSM 16634 = JCM 16172 TaxID=1423724 RepID=A0A0R1U181_9LACO|nr:hypothetical protein [Ligilactobacillus apodemi]KRL84629.1 hypothetical protein FC32_GL000527 [Ligilactobacillus apodemi DSM 16634 = JCM 16172]